MPPEMTEMKVIGLAAGLIFSALTLPAAGLDCANGMRAIETQPWSARPPAYPPARECGLCRKRRHQRLSVEEAIEGTLS